MDINAHSLRALDWAVVCEHLSACAATLAGARAATTLELLDNTDAVVELYATVQEVITLSEEALSPPLGGVSDIGPLVTEAGRCVSLQREELQELGHGIAALDRLGRWIQSHHTRCPGLARRAEALGLDADLVHWTGAAFEADGELSARAWPLLGTLRDRIVELERGIRDELERLVRGNDLEGVLQDRYVTERGGRFVLPMRASAPRTLGIVHATSNTGETVYMEPAQVVARANRLREARSDLEREEQRILTWLTSLVATHDSKLDAALAGATCIDLVVSRARLGARMQGRIPIVGRQAIIDLKQARHPVLVLRGVPVVANDLHLDHQRRCLVLTGPNTGGKTVAIKTLGLAALLVRAGIPVPCGDNSRVGVFPTVVADVGDIQTVSGDLSTFSGHVTVMKAVLEKAGPTALILLDELGVGTDPAQGAALARAVLEALLRSGARVAVTTHYAEVKALSAAHAEVRMAAMQYAHGEPTYRLEEGLAGQSHAFAIARRLALPEAIVERARSLLDAGTRQLSELMEELEERQGEASVLREQLEERDRTLRHKEQALQKKQASLERQREKLQQDVAGRYAARMREREAEVKALIAALQENPSMELAGRSLRDIKSIRDGVQQEARPAIPDIVAPPPRDLHVGDRVHIRSLNQTGSVTRVLGKDRFEVQVGLLPMKLKRAELAELDGHGQPRPPRPAPRPVAPTPAYRPQQPAGAPVAREALAGLRMDHNTLDLRGKRVDAGVESLGTFLDKMAREGRNVAFVLHGHGTGAMKTAVRAWLRETTLVDAWRPCDPGEGGDAYTIVSLP